MRLPPWQVGLPVDPDHVLMSHWQVGLPFDPYHLLVVVGLVVVVVALLSFFVFVLIFFFRLGSLSTFFCGAAFLVGGAAV